VKRRQVFNRIREVGGMYLHNPCGICKLRHERAQPLIFKSNNAIIVFTIELQTFITFNQSLQITNKCRETKLDFPHFLSRLNFEKKIDLHCLYEV